MDPISIYLWMQVATQTVALVTAIVVLQKELRK